VAETFAGDPHLRQLRHDELLRALSGMSGIASHELLTPFVSAILPELPDGLTVATEAASLPRSVAEAFTFVVLTVAPPFQVYRGAPGLHVAARNPVDGEVTVVETHTPHVPFIFESLKNYFRRQGIRVVSSIHPIFSVRRQWERIVNISDAADEGTKELYCAFHIERIESPERLRRIEHQVYAVLKSVFLAVEDFNGMRQSAMDAGARLRSRSGLKKDVDTARAFLNWLADENFVLMGTLGYRPTRARLEPDWATARGVFRDSNLLPVVFPGVTDLFGSYPVPATADGRIVDVDFCAGAHAIHHLEPLDDIVIREWAEGGELESATRLIGRLAKSAFSARPQDIPLLREKLAWVLEHSVAAARSHTYRATRAAFNQFPKRELLYADAASIKEVIDRVVRLSGNGDVAVSTRRGVGYHAVHIAFSKTRYSHEVEERLSSALTAAVGRVAFHTWADCGDAALLVFYFPESGSETAIDIERVRDIALDAVTTWEDRTAAALDEAFGPTEGRRLYRRYVDIEGRSRLYREITPPAEVPEDVRRLEQLQDRLEIRILRPDSPTSATIKLFSPTPLELVDTLRTLEHLGLVVREEVSVPLLLPEGRKGFLQRLRVEADPHVIGRLGASEASLLDALRAIQEGRASNDPLNGLVLTQGLCWRDIALLRTLRNYVLQIRPQYTADTLTAVLLKNSRVAAALFQVFAARFGPVAEARDTLIEQRDAELERATADVSSLLHDEILRMFQNVVQAVVRTNFYQQPERPVISVKIDCAQVQGMPQPRPMFEIYVHSPLLEGVHLRGGRVARGGIRWSDRPDDFRSEVLGLMSTQMLKNAIIVPVGSKGGFVLKTPLGRGHTQDASLVDRYREFIAGLLDVTDNRVQGSICHPPAVIRYDDDDPYLVVAADKGTAHLSDAANQVSAQYGFWLGDAFASGGSNGYDHKKEGITARGAWASVEHHFRLIGIDPDRQPFTVVGIGDMAGDVFGNGLLRSRMTKLVGAFNHQHVFLDPNPDPAASFAERQRLFRLPRSTWRDYDPTLISAGGGVFDRSAKSIPLTNETRALLGIDADAASGEEVIRRLLTARVDLLYNGGIGTYVKAADEDSAAVGDRANDRVRVNAADLGARVVAEGGNLGLTQRGRLEYCAKGGHINTDAVDNSGGVSMSDHEVNIKILLDGVMRAGELTSPADRNALLAGMTDEVSELVLADNVSQARALTLDARRSAARPDELRFTFDHMVASGAASTAHGLQGRDHTGAGPDGAKAVARPILALAMALAKNWGARELQETPLVDAPETRGFLHGYFPAALRDRFAAHIDAHPLRREIVSTAVINHVVNHAGVGLVPRLMVASGRGIGDVVSAYLRAEREQDASALRARVLAAKADVHREHDILLEIEDAIEASCRALLGVGSLPAVPAMASLRQAVDDGTWLTWTSPTAGEQRDAVTVSVAPELSLGAGKR
jgi:glutamate dehydrogenase